MRPLRSVAYVIALATLVGCGGRTDLADDSLASRPEAGRDSSGLPDASTFPPPSPDASTVPPPDATSPLDAATTPDALASDASSLPDAATPIDCPQRGNGTTILACNRLVPSGIAVDAHNVYWGERAAGTVVSIPIDGGVIQTLASGLALPTVGATDGAWVYWADGTLGTVMKVPVTGGSPVTLATGSVGAYKLAIDAANVYWGNNGGHGGVYQAPLAGGGTALLLAGYNRFISSVAIDGADVIFTGDGPLTSVPIGGGTPTPIAATGSDALAVYGGMAYWVDAPGDLVVGLVSGGLAPAVGPVVSVDQLTVDATGAYYTDGMVVNGVVSKLAFDGAASTIASGQSFPDAIAVDANSVYWTDLTQQGSLGMIVKAPK